MRKYGCVLGRCVQYFTCSILLYVCGASKIALMRDNKIVSLESNFSKIIKKNRNPTTHLSFHMHG